MRSGARTWSHRLQLVGRGSGRISIVRATQEVVSSADRLAFETRTIKRAMQCDLVLYGKATGDSDLVFCSRAGREAIGPQFHNRALAIDWIREWLAEDIG
jgi:hypothetical protein